MSRKMGRRKGENAIKILKKHNIASFHSDKQMNTTLSSVSASLTFNSCPTSVFGLPLI